MKTRNLTRATLAINLASQVIIYNLVNIETSLIFYKLISTAKLFSKKKKKQKSYWNGVKCKNTRTITSVKKW